MTGISRHVLKLGFIIALYFITPLTCNSQNQKQTIKFRIEVFGMDVGELNVEQQIIGQDIIVTALTNIEFKFIFTYKGNYSQEAIYRNGQLLKSHLKTIRKGKVNSDTRIIKFGENSYFLIKDGDTSFIHDEIRYSGSLVYLNEPKNDSIIFYEMNGEKKSIELICDHIYHIFSRKRSKKNDYEYEYEEGVLKSAIIRYPLANIYLKRE